MSQVINGNLIVNGLLTSYINMNVNSYPPNVVSKFGPTFTNGNSWYGGVLAPNGKIYCVPSSASSVLIIDPATNTTDSTTLSGL